MSAERGWDAMAQARKMLREVDAMIDGHMNGADKMRMSPEMLDWAFTTQRATRRLLWQLGAPEAESWWGKWRAKAVGQNWGSVKPY